MSLYWPSELDTGIAVVDRQHRRILELINLLEVHLEDGDPEALEKVLDELADYTISHLAFEEGLMEQAGYPLLESHRRLHRSFEESIFALAARHRAGEAVAAELAELLRHWLFHHIRSTDHDYVPAVQALLARRACAATERPIQPRRLFRRR